ncbi:hypothetical protein MMC29_007906 [Sticta canariensis]|nr:hypothetical protein [Sticta canariensis]
MGRTRKPPANLKSPSSEQEGRKKRCEEDLHSKKTHWQNSHATCQFEVTVKGQDERTKRCEEDLHSKKTHWAKLARYEVRIVEYKETHSGDKTRKRTNTLS